jgi:peptide/nickel transport system permease protein
MVTANIASTYEHEDAELAPTPLGGKGRKRRLRISSSKKMTVGLIVLGIFVLFAIIGPMIAPYSPTLGMAAAGPNGTQAPSAHHWLGQNNIGADVFSQLLAGTRPTVIVSFFAGAVGTMLAILIGITAGYVGGRVDDVLSLITNIFLVLPALPLLIAIGAFLGQDRTSNPLVVGLIIALTAWAWGARVMRAQTLSMRNRDFVEAARISGESTWRIIMSEIMPNLSAVIASSFLFTTIFAVGTYVGLGFLSVISPGVDYNWGSILFDATASSAVEAGFWWWYIPPGIIIALLGTSLALINFGIDEFINPRLRAATIGKQGKRLGVKLRPQLGFTPVVRQKPAVDARRGTTATEFEEAL